MNDSPEKSKKTASADPKAVKQERLAKALRANLARRKAQARARTREDMGEGQG
jgi:hypothetical protein